MDEDLTLRQEAAKPAVLQELESRLQRVSNFLLDAMLEKPLEYAANQDLRKGLDERAALEDFCVDVVEQKVFLQDLVSLSQQVKLQEQNEFLQTAGKVDQFYNETFLADVRDELARQLVNSDDIQRQELDRMGQALDQERQRLVEGLIGTLAPGQAQTLQDLDAKLGDIRQEHADVQARQAHDEQEQTAQERAEQHRQEIGLETEYNRLETLRWLAATVDYNQQCVDTLTLLQELRPASPVVLDGDGVPIQLTQANVVGPAYATEDAARQAAEAEYQRRLAEEMDPSRVKEPHILGVEIRDKEDNAVARWWEVSELDQLEKEGHTEQKMATRIDFPTMQEQGYSLLLTGVHAACEYERGCALMLDHYAKTYDIDIEYRFGAQARRYPQE